MHLVSIVPAVGGNSERVVVPRAPMYDYRPAFLHPWGYNPGELMNLLRLFRPYRSSLVRYTEQGDLDGLQRLVGLHPDNEKGHDWYLGWLVANGKASSDWTICFLEKLVELHPEKEKWCRYLLAAYEMRGDLDGAVVRLTRLIELCPKAEILLQYLDTWRKTKPASTPSGKTPVSPREGGCFLPHFTPGQEQRQSEREIKQKLEDAWHERNEAEKRPWAALHPADKFKNINRSRGTRDGWAP